MMRLDLGAPLPMKSLDMRSDLLTIYQISLAHRELGLARTPFLYVLLAFQVIWNRHRQLSNWLCLQASLGFVYLVLFLDWKEVQTRCVYDYHAKPAFHFLLISKGKDQSSVQLNWRTDFNLLLAEKAFSISLVSLHEEFTFQLVHFVCGFDPVMQKTSPIATLICSVVYRL